MKNARHFIMRSETQAIKAKNLLASNGITSYVYKTTSHDGCVYGLGFPAENTQDALSLLNANGIPFTASKSHK